MALYSATVNAAKVSGSHTDFPAYVDLSQMPASFWNTVSDGGGDIRTYADEAKTTELPREVVSCDTTTDTGELHVLIPSLTTSTVIYIDVDGTRTEPAADSTYGSEAVWGDYAFVSHDGGGTDSTGNFSPIANGGVTAGGFVGKLGQATSFDGSNDYFDIGNVATYNNAESTISAWVKKASESINNAIYSETEPSSWPNNTMVAYYGNSNDSVIRVFFRDAGGGGMSIPTSSGFSPGNLDIDSWQYVTYKRTTSSASLSLDGVEYYTDTQARDTLSTTYASVGATNDGGSHTQFFTGSIDEIRARASTLSHNWITTEYNNQSDPSSFFTIAEVATGPAYTLTAATGSYSVTGNATSVLASYLLPAASAAYTLTENDATFLRALVVNAEAGAFALSGQDAAFAKAFILSLKAGTYSVTGQDASLTRQLLLQAESGSYAFTGYDAAIGRLYTLVAEPAAYTLTGYPVALDRQLVAPMWINDAVPGGAWQAGQAALTAGATLFEGLTVYAGQLGQMTVWDTEELPIDDDADTMDWTFDAVPGGTWYAGEPVLTLGEEDYDGLAVYAGQLGNVSEWELDSV